MQESFDRTPVQITATLDVQAIERQLNELWMQNAGAGSRDEEGAMLRARVLNLMVYVTGQKALREVDELLMDVAAMHPCRALVMCADSAEEDRDIEMQVSSRCRIDGGAGGRHLCCEQVTMSAGGRFTVELPSASMPLLVSDLPAFLWWRAPLDFADQNFQSLLRAADRVIIDTADCAHPLETLRALAEFLERRRGAQTALSDFNWARLTAWRTLLANFYDAPEHLFALERLSRVRIDYLAHECAPGTVAPKALILAGWLASRLGWRSQPSPEDSRGGGDDVQLVSLEQGGRKLVLEFRRVEHRSVAQGGIARVELLAESEPPMAFVVLRAEDGRNLETRADLSAETRTTRVLAGKDKSEAELLVAELEIMSHDRIYEEAVTKAVELISAL